MTQTPANDGCAAREDDLMTDGTEIDDGVGGSWIDLDGIFPGLGTKPYFVPSGRHDELIERLRQSPFEFVEIDLSGLRNDKEFVAKFGWEIGAPSYFGENWDALEEILGDRTPDGEWHIALILLGARDFAARNLHSYARMVSILMDMSEDMSEDEIGQLEIFFIVD